MCDGPAGGLDRSTRWSTQRFQLPGRRRHAAGRHHCADLRTSKGILIRGRRRERRHEAIGSAVVYHGTRPPRKPILVRPTSATDYWSYCEERGCDVWELLSSLLGTQAEPMGLWLPECLRRPGTSAYVMGVEAPLDYSRPVPGRMEGTGLPSGQYLVFRQTPHSEHRIVEASSKVVASTDVSRPEPFGWQCSAEAPHCQFAPVGERG